MPYINRCYFLLRNHVSRHWPQLYRLCDEHKSFVKFFFAGCFSGGTDLVFLFLFHGIFHWPIVLSTSLAFLFSFIVSFSLQKFWTFRNFSHNKAASQLFLYLLNAFIGLNLNGYFMHLLVNKWNIWYILSQIIVNIALSMYNFSVYKFIIFKIGKDEANSE